MSDDKKKFEQRQKLKKYGVFAFMFLVFAGSMWLIFAPSGADKQKESSGFNAEIPDPKKDEIISDKRDAYPGEPAREKENDRVRSLEAFMAGTGQPQKTDAMGGTEYASGEQQALPASPDERNANPIRNSNAAYNDINRTLGSFYDKRGDDPEKQELKKKLEELEARMEDRENRRSNMEEQLALMEKSYQIAARYMPQGQGAEQNPFGQEQGLSAEQMKNKIVRSSGTTKKTRVSPVNQVVETVVSALSQRMSNEELMNSYDRERNYGFYSVDRQEVNSAKNTIYACIHDDQKITDGQSMRMRLTEPLIAGKTFIPENTILTGLAKIQGERMEITVSSIEYEGEIIHVELSVYDSDGQRGINIPGSMELSAAKEIAANAGSNLGSTINISQQSAGQQLMTDMGRGLLQGTSQYLGKKFRTVTVTLKAGYKLMLMPKEN